MHFPSVSPLKLLCSLVLAAGIALTQTSQAAAHAEAALLVEADSGKVIEAENATFPWHPASLTKVMTAYVTLSAVKSGRLTLDTLLAVSPNAAGQVPSKMGFAPGTRVTVDNALKMMMVKSANDMAVVLAEGVGGSVEGFSAMMNETAQRLGMTQTNYVNPNGLPDDRQVTSARDLAILARAFIRDLPDYEYYVHIPAIRYGRRVTPNFNKLIGRYPGADGMKTGFICASGFNLMATATQNGRRLIAVVLGAPSSKMRSIKAIKLLERGFSGGNLTWLKPALGTVDHLAPIAAAPPNLRDEICGPHRKRPASDNPEDDIASVVTNNPALNFFADGLKPPVLRPEDMLAAAPAPVEPVIVYTGPTRTGAELIAAAEADAAAQEAAAASARKARATKRHGGKRVTVTIDTRKPAAGDAKSDVKSDAKADAKSKSAAKPAAHASAKPAEKPAAHKPAAAAKPAATAKPAPKDKPKHAAGETKPKN